MRKSSDHQQPRVDEPADVVGDDGALDLPGLSGQGAPAVWLSDGEKMQIGSDDDMRYPFRHQARLYLEASDGYFAPTTAAELRKRFRRMDGEITALWHGGLLSTSDPERLTYDDVRTYWVFLRRKGLCSKSVQLELGALGGLCRYCLNSCVEDCRAKYPLTRVFGHKRQRVLPMDQYAAVIEAAAAVKDGDFWRLRAYAVAALSLCCGLRNVEICYLRREDISLERGYLDLKVVKGAGTYGCGRLAPVSADCRPILERYLRAADERGSPSGYVFFNTLDGSSRLSPNSFDRICALASGDAGVDFCLQDCRRTFAQVIRDRGLVIEEASVVLGHSRTSVTEDYYARLRTTAALERFTEIDRSLVPAEAAAKHGFDWKIGKKRGGKMGRKTVGKSTENRRVLNMKCEESLNRTENGLGAALKDDWTQVSIESSSPPSVSDGIQLTRSTRRSQASHPGCMSLLR